MEGYYTCGQVTEGEEVWLDESGAACAADAAGFVCLFWGSGLDLIRW